MTFSDQSSYNILFNKVTHNREVAETNYLKIFQNDKALKISVGNSYSEDQLMHTFLDNSQQGGKYLSQIAIHQEQLRR